MNKFCTTLALAALSGLFLFGCGTFKLADRVYPQVSKTRDQWRIDTMECKEKSALAANSGPRTVANFALDQTIILAPIALMNDRSIRRAVFVKCMRDFGYTVEEVK